MLSISPAMTAGHAGGYFAKEDYYLRDAELGQNSGWCGEGARELGLEGPVREEDFRALCRGEDPAGGRIIVHKLTRDKVSGDPVEEHRAGNDCTFSAPKSVSIAYAAGVDAVKEAHDAAVLSVAGHLERHHCLYRTPRGLQPGGLVAARFDHATSRNIDPQLHSHLFILNVVRTPDGKWRANDPKGIYQHLKTLGFLYRVELARELEARGFGIEIQDRSQMLFELKWVDPGLIEYFSSRRLDIERQVESWREEGTFLEVPHGKLFEMAALETRDSKRDITREEVAGIFEGGFEACGTTSFEVRSELERSREIAWEPKPPPDHTPSQVVELAARELTEREAVIERAELLDQAARISGTRHGLRELEAAIDAGADGVLGLGRDRRGREYYTTAAMLKLEAENLEKVRELSGTPFNGGVERHEVAAFRERLASEDVRLTAGQWREFENEVAGGSSLIVTTGDPGTAKTRTLGFIERFNREVLEPEGREPCTVNLAYTGKAAREMNLATGRPGFTLDSFLNAASKFELQGQNSGGAILEVAGEKVLISREVPLILRVDEAGFLGARHAGELMEFVERLQEDGVQVKLHLLGDTKQMQAISAGNFLQQVEELGKSGELEYAHLSEILRQRDPGLLEIARGLNREDRSPGENAREALAALDKRHELTEIASEPDLREAAVRHYLEESRKLSLISERARAGEGQTVLMVVGTNAQRKELNREVREARIAAGEIGEGKTFTVLAPVHQGVTVEGYRPGDTVLFTGVKGEDGRLTNWGARIGTEAKVVGIDREENLVRVSYSFTTGKRQGREMERSVTRTFSAQELAGKSALYREEERSFAAGDRIVALKNDRGLELRNGDLGTIRELDRGGKAVVDLGGRRVEIDLTRYRQVDHAYAVTIHKSQGATVEHSVMVALVRPAPAHGSDLETGRESYGHASYNALNVAVTRAQFGTHIFTNSVEGLAKAVETVDVKTSTLDRTREAAREVAHEVSGPGPGLAPSRGDLGEQIRRLGRSIPGPSPRLSVEGIKVPALPAPARELFKPAPQIQPPQRNLEKELRHGLPGRSKGLELGH
jgi:conjugative relaxase-like TrwC/TraI family protein